MATRNPKTQKIKIYTKQQKKTLKTRLNLKRNLVTFFPSLATPLLRCFSSLIDVPVYTRCSARRGRGRGSGREQRMQGSSNSSTHSRERHGAYSPSLSLSQRNVDHFCFQYEIIDSAVDSDSGSEETRAHEQVLRPHTTSPLPPHCRKWSAATERVRERHEVTCSLALPQSTLLALLCRLGALFGACLASLNNVISESVWRCVFVYMCVCVYLSRCLRRSALRCLS